MPSKGLKIRRALLTVSDKTGLVELGRALHRSGAELIATGKTAAMLIDAGLPITPIEKVSGSPEAFQGRMKTLSFPVCSGILYRRGDASDEADLRKLDVGPIDCVVVNFYPFEAAAARAGISRKELIEEVDIGGPTLVRAAAKNSPDVIVLTDPSQYSGVIAELSASSQISIETADACAAQAWDKILAYDSAIAARLGSKGLGSSADSKGTSTMKLRYGENPHQSGYLEFDPNGPVAWDQKLTAHELSYNNILDLTACYSLLSDLKDLNPEASGVVIVKHNNPCGVALIPKTGSGAQKLALIHAWEGDPISAFGGVIGFTDPLEDETAQWLAEKFVDVVTAPGLALGQSSLTTILTKRKNLKAVSIRKLGHPAAQTLATVPGGRLVQDSDVSKPAQETLKCMTKTPWPEGREGLARFGIAVTRSLKSNAVSLVREIPLVPGSMQLVGAGQGQPNRVEALQKLAIPRAQAVLRESGGSLSDCILTSDAFFPFRDAVDAAHTARIRWIVQPGGSMRDGESVAACDEHGMSMVFTGTRHFRH